MGGEGERKRSPMRGGLISVLVRETLTALIWEGGGREDRWCGEGGWVVCIGELCG